MTDKDIERLQKQYELACKEETTQFEFYLKGITFHFGLVSALLGASVAGALQVKPGLQTLLLLAGPAMTVIAAQLGATSTSRLYLVWLEKVTVRAKFEQALGLTQPPAEGQGYWPKEPIIATRNINDRAAAATSEAFVKSRLSGGYHLPTRRLFQASGLVAVILFLGLVWLAYTTWPK